MVFMNVGRTILTLSLFIVFVSTSFSASIETMLIGKWKDKEDNTIEFVKDGILIINNQGARYRIIDKERMEFNMEMLAFFSEWEPRPILKFAVSADKLTLNPVGKPKETKYFFRMKADALPSDPFLLTIRCFFETYGKVISGLSFGILILGLFLTWYQIKLANTKAKADSTNQIHKEGRTLFMSIDENVFNYFTSSQTEYSDEIKRNAEKKIHEILMYCASVYHQHNFKLIDKKYFRNVFLKELRAFLSYKGVKEYWNTNISGNELWDRGFVKMCENCLIKERRKRCEGM